MRRKTPMDYHRLAESRGFKWLGAEWVSTHQKTWWECQKGHRWQGRYHGISQGKGCPYCANRGPVTEGDYIRLAESRNFKWLGPPVPNVRTRTKWMCSNNHIWQTTYDKLRGCPYCIGNKPLTPNHYRNLAHERGFEWLGPVVKNNSTKTTWQCSKLHSWQAAYSDIQGGNGCPYCARVARLTPDNYHALARSRQFEWLGPWIRNNSIKTKWRCAKGHEFDTTYVHIQGGRGCPFCPQSVGETGIALFLSALGVFYQIEKTFKGCQDKGYLYFDFYFCLGGRIFLIEYDGIQHFKPIDYFGGDEALVETQRRDAIKTQFAQDNGFILIRIPYTAKNIEAYLQDEIEKHLPFPLDDLRIDKLPPREQREIKALNPTNWRQLRMELSL